MTEDERKLLREYVVLSYIIMDVVSELKRMEKRPQTMQGFVVNVCKDFGRRVRVRQQETRKQLRDMKIYPRILDEDRDGVVIVVSRPGQAAVRYRMQRYELQESVEKRIDELSEEWGNVVITVPQAAYKPNMDVGDPYAHVKGGL